MRVARNLGHFTEFILLLRSSEGCDIRVGMTMQVTEVRIHPANEDLVKAYATVVFDNCFMIREITVIKSAMGLVVSFPAKKERDETYRDLAFPANAKRRMMMIQRAILAEYEKWIREYFGVNNDETAIGE